MSKLIPNWILEYYLTHPMPLNVTGFVFPERRKKKIKKPHNRKGPWVFYYIRYWLPPNTQCKEWQLTDHTYFGITNNFAQRIRRHNGFLVGGAAKTQEIRRLLPGGVWLPEHIVEGFGVDEYDQVLSLEHGHDPQKTYVFCKPFANKYYGNKTTDEEIFQKGRACKASAHHPYTAKNLGMTSSLFTTMKALAMHKWYKHKSSPPVASVLKVHIFQQRFLPTRLDVLEQLLWENRSWVDWSGCKQVYPSVRNFLPVASFPLLPS